MHTGRRFCVQRHNILKEEREKGDPYENQSIGLYRPKAGGYGN